MDNDSSKYTEEEFKYLSDYVRNINSDKHFIRRFKNYASVNFKDFAIKNDAESEHFKKYLLENKEKIRNLETKYKVFVKEYVDLSEEAKSKFSYLLQQINFYKDFSEECKKQFEENAKVAALAQNGRLRYQKFSQSFIRFSKFIKDLDNFDQLITEASERIKKYKEKRDAYENEVANFKNNIPLLDRIAKEVLPKAKALRDECKFEEARNVLMYEYKNNIITVPNEQRSETFWEFRDQLLESILQLEQKAILSKNYSPELLKTVHKHAKLVTEDYKEEYALPLVYTFLKTYYEKFIEDNDLLAKIKLLNDDYSIYEALKELILPVFNILIDNINLELDGKNYSEFSGEVQDELSKCKFSLNYKKTIFTKNEKVTPYIPSSFESPKFDSGGEKATKQVKKHQRKQVKPSLLLIIFGSCAIFVIVVVANVLLLRRRITEYNLEGLYAVLSGVLLGSIYFIINCYIWKHNGRNSKELKTVTIIESFVPIISFGFLITYEFISFDSSFGLAEFIYLTMIIVIGDAIGLGSTFIYKNNHKGKAGVIICRILRILFFLVFLFAFLRDLFQ